MPLCDAARSVTRPPAPPPTGAGGVDPFGDSAWQMTYGERAALVGVLASIRPALAIEIGSMEGGSLMAAAAYADEVHSFDLDPPSLDGARAANVRLHTGDSHQLLSPALAEFAQAGRNVDYVLVDGDHSTNGVRRDIEDLLASPAVSHTVIVMHDIANELVRAGCDAVDYDAHPKVRHVDLDFVPGYMGRDRFAGELWGGLGLIIVDAAAPAYGRGPVVSTLRHHGGDLLVIARKALLAGDRAPDVAGGAPSTGGWVASHETQRRALLAEIAERDDRIAGLESQVAHHRSLWQALMRSPSWRITAPLRAAKGRLGRRSDD